MVEKKREKATWRKKERAAGIFWRKREKICLFIKKSFSFLFHFLFKSNSTCPYLIGAKRAHLFLWFDHILSHKRRKKLDLFECWNPVSVCVLPLRFQFFAFLCTRRGPFSKVGNIYIKMLRIRPWAWFRGWFCLIISCTQNDNF